MSKRKLKKKYKFILIGICLIPFLVLYISIRNSTNQYEQSNIYKLKQLNYDTVTIDTFLKQEDNIIKYITMSEKSDIYYNIITQKYYIPKNFIKYVEYKKKNPQTSYNNTIAIVNVKQNKEWYENVSNTDTSKGNAILVNKLNLLKEDYIPKDIVDIELTYSYSGNQCTKETYEAFKEMHKAAKENNLNIIINSSYRSYKEQDDVYENYKNTNGQEYADSIAARAGSSEHQTGLALDIFSPNSNMGNFEETEEYKWLINNSYKYGFILRYPKEKESITGFNAESWHFRYVGKEIAEKIYHENITFDEYYAYYKK